jgi:methyl-accepting chemotaxis protein
MTVLVMIIVAGFVLVLSVIIGIIISRIVSKPIVATAACAKAIAKGDLDAPLKVKSKDEAGQLAATIDGEVRKAFKNIENARHIADKQGRYQSAEVEQLLVNLKRLASGELLCDIAVAQADEDTAQLQSIFNEIGNNLRSAVREIKDYINDISGVLGKISQGNLDVGIESEYKGDFVELKDSINNIIASLNDVMGDINTASEQVASGSKQVSDGSQEISQGATEQASSIEELTASVTQIAEQTRQNALSANNANELASVVRTQAVQGNEQMKAMQQAMGEINEASENISKIIKVIDDIAFQTNILALNAAVEAARAGVHGKGFAVVAEEVRNLAARSANAAKETTELIDGSIKKTAAGTKIADETAAALAEIVESIDKTGRLVGEIAVASNEQATAIAHVNKGIEQMSTIVQTNSATSEEAAAASEELSSQAELMKAKVGQFRLKDRSGIQKTWTASEPDTGEAVSESNIIEKIVLDDSEFGKY